MKELKQIKKLLRIEKKVCIFVKNVASNAKGKTEKVIVVVTLAGLVCFSNFQSAEAIGCSMVMRPTSVVTVQQNSKDRYEMKFAQKVSPKLDKITKKNYEYFKKYNI